MMKTKKDKEKIEEIANSPVEDATFDIDVVVSTLDAICALHAEGANSQLLLEDTLLTLSWQALDRAQKVRTFLKSIEEYRDHMKLKSAA